MNQNDVSVEHTAQQFLGEPSEISVWADPNFANNCISNQKNVLADI